MKPIHSPIHRLALITLTACALGQSAGAQQPSAPENEARAAARERALGLERIQVSANGFQYALPPGLETPAVIEENGLVSIYEGQSTFPILTAPSSERLVMRRNEGATSPVEDMIGSLRVDEYGRRWRVVDVERRALVDAIRRYDELVEREFGVEPGTVQEDPFRRRHQEVADEGLAMWRPMSWTRTDCDGDDEPDVIRFGADDRVLASSPMTAPERKIVAVLGPDWGTGVMVDSNTVLTAAHVVTTATGAPYAPSNLDVTTFGNYQASAQARSVTAITLPGGYSGDGDFKDDYALLHLDDSTSVGWMPISQASNSTIRGADCHNGGYPGYTPGCLPNVVLGEHFWLPGRLLFMSQSTLFATTSRIVKTRVDIGPGHSGGPFFYFPSGGSTPYVTGVATCHMDLPIGKDWTGGPKGRAIRSWVIANM